MHDDTNPTPVGVERELETAVGDLAYAYGARNVAAAAVALVDDSAVDAEPSAATFVELEPARLAWWVQALFVLGGTQVVLLIAILLSL